MQKFCNLTNTFYTYVDNYFPIAILILYYLIYSLFIAYIISLNKMIIKIATDNK